MNFIRGFPFYVELPPRARRIQALTCTSIQELGTTSACAENTGRILPEPQGAWNYLRVRGEYRPSRRAATQRTGTTSACAENTFGSHYQWFRMQNYLRVRGEYIIGHQTCYQHSELPPRARRIRASAARYRRICGTTSACAENTFQGFPELHQTGNYLRVRGEYHIIHGAPYHQMELPPRARRIPCTAANAGY